VIATTGAAGSFSRAGRAAGPPAARGVLGHGRSAATARRVAPRDRHRLWGLRAPRSPGRRRLTGLSLFARAAIPTRRPPVDPRQGRRITIFRARFEEVYALWARFGNFPSFMAHVIDVRTSTPRDRGGVTAPQGSDSSGRRTRFGRETQTADFSRVRSGGAGDRAPRRGPIRADRLRHDRITSPWYVITPAGAVRPSAVVGVSSTADSKDPSWTPTCCA